LARAGSGTRLGDILANPNNPSWRLRLRRASFKGMPFYVEQQGRSSGRRTVTFEYPKRDIPYAEDMGRHAIRYQITGYLIQAPRNPTSVAFEDINYAPFGQEGVMLMPRDYDLARDNLEAALLSPGPGVLNDPYNPRLSLGGYGNTIPLYMCERYSIIEQREKGGFCMVEMSFVEAGIPGNNAPDQASMAALQAVQVVQSLYRAASAQLNKQLMIANGISPNAATALQGLSDQFKSGLR